MKLHKLIQRFGGGCGLGHDTVGDTANIGCGPGRNGQCRCGRYVKFDERYCRFERGR